MVSIYFIVHPEIIPDPLLPINLWAYSDTGLARQQKLLKTGWIRSFDAIYTSPEDRVKTAAQQIASSIGFSLHVLPDLHEINRNPTEIPAALSIADFQRCDNEFYEHPDQTNSCKWEKAIDAQKRAVSAVEQIAAAAPANWHAAIISYESLAQLLIFYYTNTQIKKPEKPIIVGLALEFDEVAKFTGMHLLELE